MMLLESDDSLCALCEIKPSSGMRLDYVRRWNNSAAIVYEAYQAIDLIV
jgi:hypothetical protein